MKKLVLGMSAAVLFTGAAFAGEGEESTKMAAADPSAQFSKLDADADGRVSAIEAANDSKVAASFTTADTDKDGYLSKTEFAKMSSGSSESMESSSSSMDSDSSSSSSSSSSTPRSDSSSSPR
ncbi:MAG: EF-hand domain-containing protein [Steroidobacteraceae bacterium]|nr:EF-hand domain-containing protein [Steroidobacteraceae bacterium]